MRKEKKEEEIKEEKKETKEKKDIEKREKEDKEVIKFEDKIGNKVETENIGQETQVSKEEIKRQNEILKNFFIWLGVVIFIVIIFFVGINSIRNFKYKGLEFSSEKYGDLIFYKTSFPVRYEDKVTGKVVSADYNFYIRNDPRKLEKEIPFNGNLVLKNNMVINATEDFNCQGDGVIAIANLLKLSLFDIEIIRDENATCDPLGRYTFIQIQPGNVSNIEQIEPACYNLNINNCEIIKVTERFMVENFVEAGKLLKK